MKNVLIICGVEPHPTKPNTYSQTFVNNARTYTAENPQDNVTVVDAANFVQFDKPLSEMFKVIRAQCQWNIPQVVIYSGHSSPQHLLVFAHCCEDVGHDERYIGQEFKWDMPFDENCKIILWGCQTAGMKGEKQPDTIAQSIANTTGKRVYGFVWRTSQKMINKQYYQLPEHGDLVEVLPK